MARVTETEVKKLISTTENITVQIDTANVLVTEKVAPAGTITTEHLKKIELWLAAHFVACSIERQTTMEKIGGTSAKFVGEADREARGLNLTSFGQQAMLLDTTGNLATLGKRKARVDTIRAIDTT